ncbi:MAG: hypothetical protein ACFFCS_10770 [Candidatus Hodarchaeota archaeon]
MEIQQTKKKRMFYVNVEGQSNFCPFCGDVYPEVTGISFCPSCGKNKYIQKKELKQYQDQQENLVPLVDEEKDKRLLKQIKSLLIMMLVGIITLPISVSYRPSYYYWNSSYFNYSTPYWFVSVSGYSGTYAGFSFINMFYTLFYTILLFHLITYLVIITKIQKGLPYHQVLCKHVKKLAVPVFLSFHYALVFQISGAIFSYGGFYIIILPFFLMFNIILMIVLMQKNKAGPWITVPRTWEEVKFKKKPKMLNVITILSVLKRIQYEKGIVETRQLRKVFTQYSMLEIRRGLRKWTKTHLLNGYFAYPGSFFLEWINLPFIYTDGEMPRRISMIDLDTLEIDLGRYKSKGGFVLALIGGIVNIIGGLLGLVAAMMVSSGYNFYYSYYTAIFMMIPSVIFSIFMFIGAGMMNTHGKAKAGGILSLIISIIALLSGIGMIFMTYNFGCLFGGILGLIGGISGIARTKQT